MYNSVGILLKIYTALSLHIYVGHNIGNEVSDTLTEGHGQRCRIYSIHEMLEFKYKLMCDSYTKEEDHQLVLMLVPEL